MGPCAPHSSEYTGFYTLSHELGSEGPTQDPEFWISSWQKDGSRKMEANSTKAATIVCQPFSTFVPHAQLSAAATFLSHVPA
jgi:hypothetical protein